MPLVRFQVRNEYGLGQPQLYKEVDRDDPKAVLDGVAVAGLVGILRQLGDLAEFAAEVFHGLQEQVVATASRSHKLMVRAQHIEAALAPLEKAVLAQTSHIHFAYTAGLEWHPRIQNEKNHFIYNDLPRFIMDSYEECRDPPRLDLLDKFDTGGPGSCSKRYSDPTFFKRASATPDEMNAEKVQRYRKSQRSKKKRGSQRHGDVLRRASMTDHTIRMQYISPIVNGRSLSSQTASMTDMALKSDQGDNSNSFDSRTESGYIDSVGHTSSSMRAKQQEFNDSPTSKLVQHDDTLDSVLNDDQTGFVDCNSPGSSLQDQVTSGSSCVNWDEKAEIVDSKGQQNCIDETSEMLTKDDLDAHEERAGNLRIFEQMDAHEGEAGNLITFEQMDAHEERAGNLRIFEQMDAHEERAGNLRIFEQMDAHEEGAGNLRTFEQMDAHEERAGNLRIFEQIDAHEERAGNLRTFEKMDAPEEGAGNLRIFEQMDAHEERAGNLGTFEQMDADEEGAGNLRTFEQMDAHEEGAGNLRIVEQMDALEEGAGNFKIVVPMDVLFDDENILESIPRRNQTDEIESEPDNFMDALNTIESESENDLDCQTKREVEHFSSFVNNEGPDGMHEITVDCSDCQTPTPESHTATSYISLEKEILADLPDSASSESPARTQMPQLATEPSNSDHNVGNNKTDILDVSRLESAIGNSTSSGSGTSNVQDKIISSSCESQESSADISRNISINFWTNGGLLGLEPSKPPDFAMPSPVSQDSANRSRAEAVGRSNHPHTLIVDEHERKLSILAENAECNEKDLNSKCSISCCDVNGDSHMSNGFSHAMVDGLKESNIMEPGTVLSVASYGKSTSNEVNQENDENSSRVFGLGRRLLVNGLGRNVPHAHDDKSEAASYLNDGVLEQRNGHHRVVYQTIPETAFKEQFERGFAVDSSPSSPPLELMKISFHPIKGTETSKLKLKLSDGNQRQESVRDMFQSFQLIPEPAVPLHEFNSDSDDDTFCRSSPCRSDDCLSHHSDSNSEQWEYSETPEINNHELYDALCGISSAEHISTSLELGGIGHNAIYIDGGIKSVHSENGLEHSLSDPLLDLPSLDALKPVLQKEAEDDSDPKDLHGLRCPGDSTPGPPPLPPVQWRVSKPHLDVTDEKQDVTEGFKNVLDTELLGSITSQQPKPAPAKQQQINEELISIKPKGKQQDQHANVQKEADKALNGKGMDEKEDFLQQIRTKSFNLRRTVPAKATTTPVPVTNVKVTAILVKANAIRQAVGSDEGEDGDSWSDT